MTVVARLRAAAAHARDRLRARRVSRMATRAMTPPPPWAYARFGAQSIVVPPARIERPDLIEVGHGVLIHEHAWLVVRDGPDGTPGRLTIGDGTVINRFVKVVCFGSVTIGPGSILGDHAYVSDVEYEPGHGDLHPEHRPLTQPAAVVIEPGAALGVGVVVKPGVTIGERAYVGAGSIVASDVPARSLAIGQPARVVRRYDPERDTW